MPEIRTRKEAEKIASKVDVPNGCIVEVNRVTSYLGRVSFKIEVRKKTAKELNEWRDRVLSRQP